MRKRKFKRILSLLLAMLMVAGMIPLSVMSVAAEEAKEAIVQVENAMESVAEDFVRTAAESVRKVGNKLKSLANVSGNGVFKYETLGNGTAQITGYIGFERELTIPSEINGYKVTSIAGYAFSNCTSLISVTIPDSVISIAPGVFSNCISLVNINVDSENDIYCDIDGVLFNKDKTRIEAYPNAKSPTYTIPNSVISIGYYSFSGCRSLTSITIPDSVIRICNGAFSGCRSLISITIPDSVTSIENYSFEGCTSLTSITIPDSVTSIGGHSFDDCTSLISVTIPDSVTNIECGAFMDCTSLTSITIPDGVTSVDDYLFCKCTSLTNVIIPDSVTSIGVCSFSGCTSLSNITIPDGVTSIGGSAFYGCKSFTSITIPDGVISIENSAFSDCTSLTSITIPDSVISIENIAFGDCTSLTSVTIPDSVISIEGNPFSGCTSLIDINVDFANVNYCDMDGVLFNKDKTSIIAYPNAKSPTYTIPDSVTSIGQFSFRGCTLLTNITIPDSVTSIGQFSFSDCISLTSITIPDGVRSIEDSLFRGCTSLANIIIPDSVTSIGHYSFRDCTSLTSITLPDSLMSILYYAFSYCTSLTDVYYSGVPEQWNAIKIADGNEVLSKVQVHYLYGLTPKEKAKRYIESLDIIYTGTDNANRVTQDIGLETENPYGLEVKWSSSNINVISCKGNVVRQHNDTNVKISVGVYYEQKGNVLLGYSKTFDLIVAGTGGTLPSEPVNGEYIKFQTLEESDAVNLLKFISKDLTDTDVKNKLSDFYRLLVGDLQNQPEYEQKVKVAFVDFVYICINSRPISNDYKINFATTALKTWLDAKGGEGTVTQPFVDDAVEIIKSALKKGTLLANGIKLPEMLKGDNIVQNFFDWSLVTINSIGGFLASRDKAQIQYLSTYLKNRDSEYLDWYLDMAALDITGFDGPQICEKLERWGETIYQIEKSLESNVKTTYIAKCPVVMEVYDSSGEMIAILDNDKEGALYNPYGAFQVVKEPGTQDFIKIARLYSDDCYVKIRGVGNGEMNLTVEEAQNNGETKNFEVTLSVSDSTEFTVLRGETTPRITVHDLNSETLDEAVQMAEIDRNKYSVTATSTDGGFVLGGETAYEGSDVILTAYPEDDYAFAGWYENGKLISNERCISITLNENRNFHAVFYCPVTGITLDKANITLKIGEFAEILPKLSPQNASNKAVSWKSSNPNVVSVDEKGNIKAIASGSAIITAMTKDGGYTAKCVVNVLKPDFNVTINGNVVNGDVAYVKLPSAFTLYKNFYATLGFSLDSEVEVQSVKWNYANWSQANPEANIESPNSFETIIRPNGKGIGARSAWITVTVTDIYGNVYSDTIKVRFYKWDWQI